MQPQPDLGVYETNQRCVKLQLKHCNHWSKYRPSFSNVQEGCYWDSTLSDITLSRITPILSTIKLYVGSSSTKHMCQPQIIRHSLIYRGSGRWRGRAPSTGEGLIISRNSQSQNVPLRLSNGLWRSLFCRILFRVLYRYSN